MTTRHSPGFPYSGCQAPDANYVEWYSRYVIRGRRTHSDVEQRELFDRFTAGDQQAFDALVTMHLPFVLSYVTQHYMHCPAELRRDLVAAGNAGLCEGVRNFDPSKGAQILSYAVWWIKQYIRKELEKSSVLQINWNSYIRMREWKRGITKNDKPNINLRNDSKFFAATIELDEEKTVSSVERVRSFLSKGTVGEDDMITDCHTDHPLYNTHKEDTKHTINQLLGMLTERERRILRARFGLAGHEIQSIKEIATTLGISAERVRQISHEAIFKLKAYFNLIT